MIYYLPRLNRALIATAPGGAGAGVDGERDTASAPDLPETIVQFGTGAFLRGFVADLVDDANRRGMRVGSIVAVGSTGSGREETLNEQGGLFTLEERGVEGGAEVRRHRVVQSISRALSAVTEWEAVLALARAPDVRWIVSNTTEVGIASDQHDLFGPGAPRSFPGKLARFLYERATTFAFDPTRGVIVLPCELIDHNAEYLQILVLAHAARWRLDSRFEAWLDAGTLFCDTLVDRIVPGAPRGADLPSYAAALRYDDRLITLCEPYRLFVIQGDGALLERLPFAPATSGVVVAEDIAPFRLRKLRLLNGAHTIMASAALLCGLETVGEAIRDERMGRFVRRVLFDEIVPTIGVDGGEAYAHDVVERLSNLSLNHPLVALTLHGTAKMRARVTPTIDAFIARRRRVPESLAFGFAAFLLWLRDDPLGTHDIPGATARVDFEGTRIREAWRSADASTPTGLATLVRSVCADGALWPIDLSRLGGFVERVTDHLARAIRDGVPAALDAHLAAASTSVDE